MRRARALAALQKPNRSPTTDENKTNCNSNGLPNGSTASQLPLPVIKEADYQRAPAIERDVDEEVLESFDMWDPMAEDFYSADNTLELNPDKEPECVVTGQMSEEYAMLGKYRVCDFYLKHGACADGEYCSRLHIEPGAREALRVIQDSTLMKSHKTCLFRHQLMPSELDFTPGSLLMVSLTSIEAPNKFQFLAPYEQMNFEGFNEDEINFYAGRVQHSSPFKTKLTKCHEQLALLFDHNYRVDNIKDSIFLEQIVACKLEDGRFYRGAVLDRCRESDQYKVDLIDTGKEAILSRTDIFSIRANCLNDAPMSVMASLRLRPPKGQLPWPQEAHQALMDAVSGQKYMLCEVLSIEMEDILTVDLFDISTRTSLTNQLLAKGLGEPTYA